LSQILARCPRGGVLLYDGSVLWIIDDIRDCTPVGAVTGRLYLPPGYIKANGATVARADYPRLVALADKYNLWTDTPATFAGLFGKGDGSTTFALPDYGGKFKELVSNAEGVGAVIAAGLPNITAYWNIMTEFNSCSSDGAGYFDVPQGIRTDGAIAGGRTGIRLNASRSSAIYGASTTVQPPAIAEMAVIRY